MVMRDRIQLRHRQQRIGIVKCVRDAPLFGKGARFRLRARADS